MGVTPDNIVISPGPGRPDVQADFGMCAQALREAVDVPILGVCLGHEGLGLAHGARVVRAREPMHGRLSPVFHDGDALFRGVPQGARVVRYHSLVVDPSSLPIGGPLRATAWTGDGELMALRHERYPHWGVQFHPESVGTRYGSDIMRNFRDVTLRWRRRGGGQGTRPNGSPSGSEAAWAGSRFWSRSGGVNGGVPADAGRPGAASLPSVSESMPVSRELSSTRGEGRDGGSPPPGLERRPLVLHVRELSVGGPGPSGGLESLPFMPDSEEVFRAVYAEEPTAWWLDSSSQRRGLMADGQAKARFSFMGGADGPLSQVVECYTGDTLLVEDREPGTGEKRKRAVSASVLEYIRAEMAKLAGAGGVEVHGGGGVEARFVTDGTGREPTGNSGGTRATLPFDFMGGFVGYLGYELRHVANDILERSGGGTEWHWGAPGGQQWERTDFEAVDVTDAWVAERDGNNERTTDPITGEQESGTRLEGGEARPTDDPDVPLGFLVFVDRFLAFDHKENKVYLLALAQEKPRGKINGHEAVGDTPGCTDRADGGGTPTSHDSTGDALRWLEHTAAVIRGVASSSSLADEARRGTGPTDEGLKDTVCTMDISRHRYEQSLREIMKLVEGGETYEVCLTNQIVCERPGGGRVSPLDLYGRLRRSNPAPYAAYLLHDPRRRLGSSSTGARSGESSGPSFAVCCSSPERFLKVDRAGWVESKPIKGTVKR